MFQLQTQAQSEIMPVRLEEVVGHITFLSSSKSQCSNTLPLMLWSFIIPVYRATCDEFMSGILENIWHTPSTDNSDSFMSATSAFKREKKIDFND